MTADEVLASYLEASRLGDTMMMTGENRVTKLLPAKIEGAPLFDYGPINDLESGQDMGKEVYDGLFKEWADNSASFKLPYPEQYLYLIYRHWTTIHNMFFINQNEVGTIQLESWFWQPALNDVRGKWTLMPLIIGHDPSRNDEFQLHWAIDPDRLDQDWVSERTEDVKTNFSVAMAAFVLLNRSGTISVEGEPTPRVLKINAKRERVRLDAIAKPIVIRIEDKREVLRGAHRPSGITMRPHDRRGHYRTRKATGVKYWVRSAKIHGGSETSPTYTVET